MTSLILLTLGAAAIYAVAFAAVLMPLARRWGWMDHPSGRKVHEAPTPLAGGMAVFLALGALLWFLELPDTQWLMLGAFIVLATGLVDDRWPQSAGRRFLAQSLACAVMIWGGGVVLGDFGQLFGPFVLELGILAAPVTLFAALGVINAMNMIDGLDGQCSSVFLVACTALGVLAWQAGNEEGLLLVVAAAGAVLGFWALNARLPWNRRARLFLGDSGSALLGFVLAWLCIDLGSGPHRTLAPMTAVWILGIPLLDTTRLIRRRWREGGSALQADQFHLHHLFLRSGFSNGATWAAIVGLCALSAGIGLCLEWTGVPEYWRFYGYIAFGLVYLGLIRRSWRSGRFLGRAIAPPTS